MIPCNDKFVDLSDLISKSDNIMFYSYVKVGQRSTIHGGTSQLINHSL